jgi:CRP/FNR family transcriptional regulator, cyclic AMP receptor protein
VKLEPRRPRDAWPDGVVRLRFTDGITPLGAGGDTPRAHRGGRRTMLLEALAYAPGELDQILTEPASNRRRGRSVRAEPLRPGKLAFRRKDERCSQRGLAIYRPGRLAPHGVQPGRRSAVMTRSEVGMDRHTWIDERLRQVPMFQELSNKQLSQISSLMTRIERPSGTVLIDEGRVGHEFFIVLEGQVEVRHGDQVLATRGPGDYFGEIALIDEGQRMATITASTELVCHGLTYWEFRPLVQGNGAIGWKLLQSMAQMLRAAQEQPSAAPATE